MQEVFNKIFCGFLLFSTCDHRLLAWSSLSNSKLKTCPEERTTSNGTFKWKLNYEDGGNYVVSEPDVCWENDTIVLRECDLEKGEWLPNQVECRKFQRKNSKCPDDLMELFTNNEYVCLKVSSQRQPFNEEFCYGSNHIIGHSYEDNFIDKAISMFLLEKLNIVSFWMPIKRYEESDFSPFVIRMPGDYWNEWFFDSKGQLPTDQGLLKGKHCIVSFIRKEIGSRNHITLHQEMTHCSEAHYSVCIIKKHFVASSGCPQDFGALRHRPNECFGITRYGQQYLQDFRMLNVTEYFSNMNTINIIFEELDIADDNYVEVEGAIKIPGRKWAIKPKTNQMKIVSSMEKIHGLCVEYIEQRKNVEMVLRMDPDLDALILVLYNKFYIWSDKNLENAIYCFTNAGYEKFSRVELKKIWENDLQTKTIFKVKIKSDVPSQYWCEAHTIFNFTYISTQKVIAAKNIKGHTFAMQIAVPAKHITFPHIFATDQSKYIALLIKKDLKNVLKQDRQLNALSIHNVRIMDIPAIQTNESYLRCLCHTTTSVKSAVLDTSDNSNSAAEEEDTAGRMSARNLLIYLMHKFQPQLAQTVRSIEFCLPENEWMSARFGQSATKSKLCIQENGLPLVRRCLGDFMEGAYWEALRSEDCTNVAHSNRITNVLYGIEKSIKLEHLEKQVRDVRKLLESNLNNLIPADIHYLSTIIQKSVKSTLMPRNELTTLKTVADVQRQNTNYNLSGTDVEIVRIFNLLFDVKQHVIRPSVILNSTNILLDAFEYFIDCMPQPDTFSENTGSHPLQIEGDKSDLEIIEHLDAGVVTQRATNFLVFAIDPQVTNVTGIALFRRTVNIIETFDNAYELSGAFRGDYYKFILANQSIESLLNEDNILIGTFVPATLLQRLDEISMMSNTTWHKRRPKPKIVIKIFTNDKMFQEAGPTSDKVADGKVVSISIPGHDKDLPEILPVVLTISNDVAADNETREQFCSYWNYQTWARDGVMIVNRSALNYNTVLCGCTHLTPFAYLIGGTYKLTIDRGAESVDKIIHKQALDIITLLGCSLSLLGIVGIFLTAGTFRSWRKRANSKVILQLAAAIALEMILFCFVNTEQNTHHLISNQIYTSCIIIGASLHYSVLVQFCWMIIIAYLQFKRYVQVFGNTRPQRFLMKSTVLAWGLPVLPVACVLVFDSNSYIPQPDKWNNRLCYPSGISFYTSIVAPVTLVIIANLIIFIIVMYNILKNTSGTIRHTEKSLALSQIRLFVLLFFLLGFTWIFGLLNAMKAGLAFSYLFCLTATLQGFILFVYFVLMDPTTRHMWYKYFKNVCGFKLKVENASSLKEPTESL